MNGGSRLTLSIVVSVTVYFVIQLGLSLEVLTPARLLSTSFATSSRSVVHRPRPSRGTMARSTSALAVTSMLFFSPHPRQCGLAWPCGRRHRLRCGGRCSHRLTSRDPLGRFHSRRRGLGRPGVVEAGACQRADPAAGQQTGPTIWICPPSASRCSPPCSPRGPSVPQDHVWNRMHRFVGMNPVRRSGNGRQLRIGTPMDSPRVTSDEICVAWWASSACADRLGSLDAHPSPGRVSAQYRL